MEQKTEVTEKKYDYAFEVLPPIYVTTIDDKPVQGAFAVSEPYDHNEKGAILAVFFKENGRYFKVFANLFTADGKSIWDTHAHCYRRLKAISTNY